MATGADQGFQVRRGELKKIVPSGGRHENLVIFRVKIHDFTPKNLIFSNFRGGVRQVCPPGSTPGQEQVNFQWDDDGV
jgi:hypothetical protein